MKIINLKFETLCSDCSETINSLLPMGPMPSPGGGDSLWRHKQPPIPNPFRQVRSRCIVASEPSRAFTGKG